MDTARIEWWKTDRNKDGKLQYSEFPHPDWKRANRNNDDVVDWAEEVSDRVLKKLAQEGDFLAKHGNDSQKQWPSIYAWGVAHPGFEQIFHFVDWDRDGKITSAEYTAFEDQLDAYNDPSFPTTNQKDKPAKTFGRRKVGEEIKRRHEDEAQRGPAHCANGGRLQRKRSWPGHGRCGPLSIRIATTSGNTMSSRTRIGSDANR